MKRLNLLALLLALCLALSSCVGLIPNENGETQNQSTAGSVTEVPTEDDTTASGSYEDTTEEESESSEIPEEINFFMINDNHGSFVGDGDSVGVERLAGLLDKLEGINGKYIKIANGDILQGTYVSSSLRGLPMIEALNEMDFDCFVIGNHEFDWGIEEIAKYADGDESNGEADFPFLGANIFDKQTGERVEWIDPYVIIEYEGYKVGVIGVIGQYLESSILTSKVENYEFRDYKDIVARYASELRGLGCDAVVVSTHDYDEETNQRVASLSGESRIDAIFCGHTHRKINESALRPDGYAVPIVQNWGNGDMATGLILKMKDRESVAYTVNQYQIKSFDKNVDMKTNVVDKYSDIIAASNRVVGNTTSYLSKDAMGELCCNAMSEVLTTDISMINTGGVRADIQSGAISIAEIFAVFPFENTAVKVEMTGEQIKALYDANGSYLYFNSDFDIYSIDPSETYSVGVIDYVYENPRYADLFHGLTFEYTDIITRDIVIEYVEDTLTVSIVLPYYCSVL